MVGSGRKQLLSEYSIIFCELTSGCRESDACRQEDIRRYYKKVIGCCGELAGKEDFFPLKFRGFAAIRKIMNLFLLKKNRYVYMYY